MKELIPMDTYGVFADTHDTARANSLQVAEYFEKRHDIVLRDVKSLDCSEKFRLLNFVETKYIDSHGRKQPCICMTRDGFMFLAMGYRGKKAAAIKEAYINRFNDMERFIHTLVETRQEFPLLTANIKLVHEHPMPYHFSNEADMLNRLVIGQTAKQFRQTHGLDKHESIRPYLTEQQISTLDTLQKVDIGLLLAMPDFEQRKRQLQWYLDQTARKYIGA
ncbi:Rha family transcriptional regulator [Oscillibacter sp.]|uniref:Rha family transcriptional regulator n=1 Tax=Oscillibacter sp. TaxID=1945593 RepID=UPI00289E1039|nr:Rha family transcriptional regulator [Oscillibacter sp.]